MLFDLRGKRRRAVQVTYLSLALLMGGGLIFFGIGGSVSGGLLDAFKGGGGGSNGNELLNKRVKNTEKQLRTDPRNTRLLASLTRDYYQLAQTEIPQGKAISDDARDDLNKSASYWKRYSAITENKADPSLANLAVQMFSPEVLNKPKDGLVAARVLAEDANSAQAYLQVVQFAALAGDSRTADLATVKAVDLAPKGQKKQVKQLADQYKKLATQSQAQGG